MEEQPLDSPGDDSIDDMFIRRPIIFDGIINAQARERRRIAQPVNMLGGLAGAARVGTDGRIDDKDADVGVRKCPAIKESPRKIDDADAIDLANWAKCAFPYADPARMRDKAELGT
jgi:hypothetical protein